RLTHHPHSGTYLPTGSLLDENPGSTLSGNQQVRLKEHCKEHLAPYKYPRWITFVDELPKTATGKIQRFRLREKA
ncbi:acyl-coenzyme A synthetase/AMP-(fatty) acid ligase, partial [Sphingobium wenxiniae]|uniref:AMP-binding enzyme n=1 Tax=Sphingobium wenxiniae (strain DSM 21828 / CGMCC 1.7748 / JZ-1) TaxID=595605 RepID=UPI0017AD9739